MVTGSRDTTTVAPQALYLLNDPFVRRQSLALAERLLDRTDLDDDGRVDLAYRLTLGRAGNGGRDRAGRAATSPTTRPRPARPRPTGRAGRCRAGAVARGRPRPRRRPRPEAPCRPQPRRGRTRRTSRSREEVDRGRRPADGRLGELLPGPARLGRVPIRPVSSGRRRRIVRASTERHDQQSFERRIRSMLMTIRPIGRGRPISRRQALKTAGAGFGYLALAGLLGQDAAPGRAADRRRPARWRPKPPHFPAKAKRIIFLFMQGAISQMDTWEYKPQLQKDDGKVGPGGGTLDRLEVQVRPARPDRHLGLGAVPAPGQARRQALLPPRPAHRHAGPPAGGHPAPHRHGPRLAHPAVDGRRGCCTAWAPRTRTCPATSPSTRRRTSAARSTTAAPSCPAHFQGTRINDTGYVPNLQGRSRPRRSSAGRST